MGVGQHVRFRGCREIEQEFKARLDWTVNVLIEEEAGIPAEKSGKFRYVASNVVAA